MRRKFLTNLSLLILLNLLIKPFWIFGIDRTVQNLVGAEEYGLYFSLFNFSLILNILLDLGITNYNNRNIAQHHQLLSKSLSNIIGLRFILAVIYATVTLGVAFVVGYEMRQFKILGFLIVNQFIASFILYLRSNLSGLQYFKTDSIISVLDRFIMIFICSFLLWSNYFQAIFKIEWFVYAQTVAYSIAGIIASFIVYRKTEFLRINFDRAYFIAVLKKSYPFAILALLMMFYYRIDSVMLERMLPNGKEQAGIYAQGFRILDAVAMFAFLFAGLLLPMFSKMIRQNEPIGKLTQFSFLLLIVPSIGISFAGFFYRVELMDLLYHQHVQASSDIFGILMLCFIGISTSYIFGTLLTANGNMRIMNLIALASVVINVVLNLLLIPKYQALGSAVASLLTQSIAALTQMLVVQKVFKLKLNTRVILLLSVYTIVVYLLSYFSVELNLGWIFKFLAVLILSFMLAFLFRLIHLKLIFRLLVNGDEK